MYTTTTPSEGGTIDLTRSAGALVRYEYQQGKDSVIRQMLQGINAECYIMTDGDDTYPAGFALEMVCHVLERQADMVMGERLSSSYIEENIRPFYNLGNYVMRWSINTLFKDIMAGNRAFSYRFVKTFLVMYKGSEIETEMSMHAINNNMHVENAIIEYRDYPEESGSKLNTYFDGLKMLCTIVHLSRTHRPMSCFGLMVAVLFMISLVFSSQCSRNVSAPAWYCVS